MAQSNPSNTSSIIDNSNPYFISSSDNPSYVLVSNLFNGLGFNSWKRSMIIALSAKNKIGFVDGSISKPAATSPMYSNWIRVNSMVISWILNSLSKNISESVLFLETASQIWSELNQRYEQSNGALQYQIQQQLFSLSQGSDDFSSYFTKLTKIWDELRIIQNLPPCSCGTAAGIHKFLEEQRLIQLLMGLNDTYKVVRGQILMMKPLPSVSTAYSIILQEEQQRGINSTNTMQLDAIAMHVSSDNQSGKRNLICNHCKKSGHTKSQCYRLIGFPPTFKFTKSNKEQYVPKVTAHSVTASSSSSGESSTHAATITQDQYNHLLQLFSAHNIQPSPNSSQANFVIHDSQTVDEGPFIEE